MPIAQTAKQAAIATARQVARQSNEILNSARQQIAPTPEISRPESKPTPSSEPRVNPEQEKQRKEASLRNMMRSYDTELSEIRRENLFKELQRKISEGEEVPLEDFAGGELSSEQKDVLKAQMEAVQAQKNATQVQSQESPLQVVAKKGRNAMMGMFKKKNETHVETRQPPSG